LLIQSYHYFSSGVSLFQVSKSVSGLIQFVSPVDNRCNLSRLHEIGEVELAEEIDGAMKIATRYATM